MNQHEIPIYVLSSGEANAYNNFLRVEDMHGAGNCCFALPNMSILESHKYIASVNTYQKFAVVDGDCYLTRIFLDTPPATWGRVNLWYARNPINGLVYGHGAPKVFAADVFDNVETHPVDMTFGLTGHVQVIETEVAEHRFNWSALSAWRTAYREVIKLQVSGDKFGRIPHWVRIEDKASPFADYCVAGAVHGLNQAILNDPLPYEKRLMLEQLNDFAWLKSEFEFMTSEKA